jgi:hypothetical protein
MMLASVPRGVQAALVGSWALFAHAVPSTGVEARPQEIIGGIAKLDALLTAYSRNPQGENLLNKITVASDELSVALVSLNTAVEEAFDVLSLEEQESLQSALESLVSDALLPLAEKGNTLFTSRPFTTISQAILPDEPDGIPAVLWLSSRSFS